MSSTLAVSLSALTIQSAIVLALAIVVMLPLTASRRPNNVARVVSRRGHTTVVKLPTEPYRRPNVVRRLVSLVLSGAIGILVGVLVAILVAYTISFAVIRLNSLLQG